MRLSKECGRVLGALALATLMAACQQEEPSPEKLPERQPPEQAAMQAETPAHDVEAGPGASTSTSTSANVSEEAVSEPGTDAVASAVMDEERWIEPDPEPEQVSHVAADAGQRPATPEDVLRALGTLTDALDSAQQGQAGADQDEAAAHTRIHDVWTDTQPPLSVEFQTKPLTTDMISYRIVLRSRADRLIVYDIRLNRGNCGVAEVGQFNEGLRLPVALNFGHKKTVRVHRCDRVLEAVVDTQYGEYIFTWN